MERDDDNSGLSGLLNKAKDAVSNAMGGGEGDTTDNDLIRETRSDTTGTSDPGVNMFDSGGDDSVPTAMGDRARQNTGYVGEGYGGSGTDTTADYSSGTDATGYAGSGTTDYASGGADIAGYGGSDASTVDYGSGTGATDFGASTTDMGSNSFGTQSDYGTGVDRGAGDIGTGFGSDMGTADAGTNPGYDPTGGEGFRAGGRGADVTGGENFRSGGSGFDATAGGTARRSYGSTDNTDYTDSETPGFGATGYDETSGRDVTGTGDPTDTGF